ncbi:uncharacterized protein A1O9_01575 [Exophiala aquamarina CBS 119918]|uniref:HSF-type DNA-binding domain-containing protein n=1 Tax=Exophiala aquamarina CBS 119918 TaxID=1182545 RepID=A0A072PV15_9EURO|nr:uncharacterized protein A1O9_01575 [Exophiala aquamarina CBS 119918]KEF63597.1 hypothetical protein A1O9_01575 [Exophiala aquamarina CBS 119918]
MASQGLSRKRPAPGTSPVSYPQQMHNPTAPAFADGVGPQLSNDQFLQWGQAGQNNLPQYNENNFAMNSNTYPQANPQPSNQLTRRPMAQLSSRGRVDEDPPSWVEAGNAQAPKPDPGWSDDIADLEAKAQVAKKEAQAKRKQIPPFVQKLNSFLEDGKNTDLIRWSDDGNSFIVLDEDEFAKKLIPELFKHNNYASFVRQLNMYGFHKKVGLSDNSMRASERKNKSPSEYTNPYFRRGHPDLLWLIQKPKNITGTGNKRKGKSENDANEDDPDDYVDDIVVNNPEARVRSRPGQLTLGQAETALTQEQFQSVQRELAAIRHQQGQISRMMQALKREHEQLYGQAATFQDQHNRHENSINAILTFLATVYNRSLQGHDAMQGMQGIANMFGNAMPVDTSQANVVDVGDFTFDNLVSPEAGLAKSFKKQQLLLTDGQQGRASTLSPRDTSNNSPYPQRARLSNQHIETTQQPHLSPNLEEVFDPGVNGTNTGVQPNVQHRNANIPQRDMMSMIQNANARNSASPSTPQQDFNSVLNSLEASGGTGPLNSSQRSEVLRMMNDSARQPSGSDNALINSTPPPGPANFHRNLASTNADLDHLAKLQAEQDKSVQNLTNLLQPLSPTGSIPGIGDGQSLPAPPLDIDDFLNNSDYFTDFPTDANGNYDFGNTGLGNTSTNHNTAGTSGLDFGDYKDDDELFGNLSQSSKQQGFGKNYDYNPLDGTADTKYDASSDFEGGGRIESVPSSEVTTPNSTDVPPATTVRPKGRKLSSIDDDSTTRKRRRS